MKQNSSLSYLIDSSGVVISAVVAFLLPLAFLTNTTEFFTFPKQILMVAGVSVLLLLYCVKSLAERKIVFVKNPLNLGIFVLGIALAVSSYASPSASSSLFQMVPAIAAIIMFYVLVNLVRDKQGFRVILVSLIIGGVLASLITILSSFKIYLLPFEATRNEFFNTFGSPVQMIGFLTPLLIFTFASVLNQYRKKGKQGLKKISGMFYGASFAIFTITIGIIFYRIAASDVKPVLLPFDHGFQLALASISQNEARLLPSFLFGSGYGTFSDVFTRFHLPSFNQLASWNLTFSFSSSYVLELIATTGILGLLSFVYVIIRFVKSNSLFKIRPLYLATGAALLLSFIIPFAYPMVALTFILLALYILSLKLNAKTKSVEEVSLSVVSSGSIFQVNDTKSNKGSFVLPVVVTLICAGMIVYSLFFLKSGNGQPAKGLYHYVLSDITFAESLRPEALNSGEKTYNLLLESIQMYPYRADLYRIFSQVNLALASNLVQSQTDAPTVSQDVQNAIIQQLQQAINSARQSVILARESSLNWRNLGQVYRNLIGVGENAEQFAIDSYNQAISLDPNNPLLRIELGGIYFQLNEFDLAQSQFATAASLKNNYANAYYNLGHALESKGSLELALQQYIIVRQLVQNNPQSLELINAEIEALQAKITNPEEVAKGVEGEREPSDDTNLNLEEATQAFPERDPREAIPAPPRDEETVSEPTPTSEPSPTSEPTPVE